MLLRMNPQLSKIVYRLLSALSIIRIRTWSGIWLHIIHPISLGRLTRAHANPHSSSSSKTQQRPRSLTSLSSQEHKSSSDEWEKLLISDRTQDTNYLLILLHVMGGSQIRRLLLDRALLPQRRWNASGIQIRVTALEAGLDQHLLDILSDTDRTGNWIFCKIQHNKRLLGPFSWKPLPVQNISSPERSRKWKMEHRGSHVDLLCLLARSIVGVTAQFCICREVAFNSSKSYSTDCQAKKRGNSCHE